MRKTSGPEFEFVREIDNRSGSEHPMRKEILEFHEFGQKTRVLSTACKTFDGQSVEVETFVNEFWTSKQRTANSLHEVSYRACFKPQLPRFFIERLTRPGDVVYDPFMGRGTTLVEAALLGRTPRGCDINPLSVVLTKPRLTPPSLTEVEARLKEIDFSKAEEKPENLLVFYHPETLQEICALREYFIRKKRRGVLDSVDEWIRMVAINRLTGHSPGFFSVYTLPPNQAVSAESQAQINRKRNQTPPRRHVAKLILKKSKKLLSGCDSLMRKELSKLSRRSRLVTSLAFETTMLKASSIDLAVTSPPFLDVVNYAGDNWLRCWFIGVDPEEVKLTVPKKLEEWKKTMTKVMIEVRRLLKKGGHFAFEVGEVRGGKIRLEEAVIPCAIQAGLEPQFVLINDQKFTKTANCWGVDNNFKGTNTNRIILLKKSK